MIFGTYSLEQAVGVVLAHTLRIGACVLKKGHRVTSEDVVMIQHAGIQAVLGARLESGDVGEDEAARFMAEAIAGANVEVSLAHTGRCNLYATASGLVTVVEGAIDSANLFCEAITVGTLLPWSLVKRGDVVATVKVIPFAVEGQTLDACRELVAGRAPVTVAPFYPHRAALILSEASVTRETVLDRTVDVTRQRLEALGSTLSLTLRCGHESDALKGKLLEARVAGCSIVLICGASITKDVRDIVPAAIIAAGGTVEHFGMPVEPGNMLLLARLGDMHVINLPGCARSLRLNGFDWILRRLLANLTVTARDIMLMGVGGLIRNDLEEDNYAVHDNSRPQYSVLSESRVAALVLAAGRSTRMGEMNKLVAIVDGVPMVVRVVNAAIASRVGPVVVVTGHEAALVEEHLAERDVTFVRNMRYMEGMATSLSAGICSLTDDTDAVLVLLGDMPYVSAAQIDRLLEAHAKMPDAICVPCHRGWRGNPVLWPRRYFKELASQTGDVGGRALLDEYAEQVRLVEMNSNAVLRDIDTAEAMNCTLTTC